MLGVIPNARVFLSGRRDLKTHNPEDREILRSG
jgi:hypothetical protein